MIIEIEYNSVGYKCDLADPLDISIPLGQVKCFYAPDVTMAPVVAGDFIGSVKSGAPVNFYNVGMNPHGNGTHTEGVGHITLNQKPLTECLNKYHFMARLITVGLTEIENGDHVITESVLQRKCENELPGALIIRTLPNNSDKLTKDYSGTNPPYLTEEAMKYIVSKGVKHLLIDLPSVDREEDEGKLANHNLFWNLKSITTVEGAYVNHTITELIYVPQEIIDGIYLLNIQVPTIVLDVAPSKPVLYQLTPK